MPDLTAKTISDLNILVFGAETEVATAAMDELHDRALNEYRWSQDGVTDEIPAPHTCNDGCTSESCYQRYRTLSEPPLPYGEWVQQVSDYERD